MVDFLLLAGSTFISEDLTCITGGILAKEGKFNLSIVILACTVGIYLGDAILFFTGRYCHKFLLSFSRWQSVINSEFIRSYQTRLNQNLGFTIFLCRFLPGTRLPIYVFAGISSKKVSPFLIYSLLASLLWTPTLVLSSFYFGKAIENLFFSESVYFPILISVLSFYIIYRLFFLILIKDKRNELVLFLKKTIRLEFWPSWVFYFPLVPYAGLLTIRYLGFRYITASNPGIFAGGIAGESKSDILANLPIDSISKFKLLSPNINYTEDLILQYMKDLQVRFPIIIKPDMGERGAGVHLVHSVSEAIEILKNKVPFILQEYHAGPWEAGIFYYRFPNEPKGHILSITDKVFPVLLGDGKKNLRDLITEHKRFQFQKNTYFQILSGSLDRIPALGEKVKLGFAGNHIQGCMFKDGSGLITDALEQKIDEISKEFKGFYFGRYDIRYSTKESLKQGKDFKIIELNGAMSESTNLYDPDFSIIQSYRYLFKQWAILFKIGYQNYKSGNPIVSWHELYLILKNHARYKKGINPVTRLTVPI